MFKQLSKLKNQAGIATDEAILASIMVASLGAFVFVNVPWDSMFSTANRLVTNLESIETANNEFYERHRLWPHQTTTGDWRMNVNALVSPKAMRYPYNNMVSFKNYLSEMSPKYTENGVRHDFGEGGSVLQRPISVHGKEYIEIILENVPLTDARKLDNKIDGEYNPDTGRVTLKFDEARETANVHYRANRINGRDV